MGVCAALLVAAALGAFIVVRRRRRKQAEVEDNAARQERRASHRFSQSGRAISGGTSGTLSPAPGGVVRANL